MGFPEREKDLQKSAQIFYKLNLCLSHFHKIVLIFHNHSTNVKVDCTHKIKKQSCTNLIIYLDFKFQVPRQMAHLFCLLHLLGPIITFLDNLQTKAIQLVPVIRTCYNVSPSQTNFIMNIQDLKQQTCMRVPTNELVLNRQTFFQVSGPYSTTCAKGTYFIGGPICQRNLFVRGIYLIQGIQGFTGRPVFGGVGFQSVADGVHQQREPRDSLHRQQQEGDHGKALAGRVPLQSLDDLGSLWTLPVETEGGMFRYDA